MPTDRALTGLALRLFAIACLATMAALIKLVEARGASLAEILFHRQFWAIPLVMAWISAGDGLGTIRTTRFAAHAGRAAVGVIGMVFNFASVMLLPLAESTTLLFTVPIFATVLSALALRERVGPHRWTAVVLGFVGVIVVAQPSGGHFPLIGTAVCLIAAIFMASVAVLLRQLGKTESTGTTVFWFSLLSLPPFGIAYAFSLQPHDWVTWAMLVGIGLIGGVGQLGLTGALRYAPVSTVVPMDYSSLVWATLYGWVLFGVLPTPYTWIGAPIIIGSGLYIVWREQRLMLSSASATQTPLS
jgi:drug/metabolite transporter (DMT)-like permease